MGAPSGISSREEDGDITIVVSWFQGMGIAGLLGALVMALPSAVFFVGGEEVIIALGLALPALLLLWWSLAATLNRTTITFGKELSSGHGPIPWPHGFRASIDRVQRVELRERRFVRHGRVVRVQYDSVAIVDGAPHRLAPGIMDRARHEYIVTAIASRLAELRGPAAQPGAPAPARAAVPAAPAANGPVERALAELRGAGARDVDGLEALLRRLAPHLAPPFRISIEDVSPYPFVHATLPPEGKPAFGALHLAHRPDDFRKRIWVRHMEQLMPLLQRGTRLSVSIGLRGGGTGPVNAIETDVDGSLDAALALAPMLEAGAIQMLRAAFDSLGVPPIAIESRLAPPGLLTATFWASPAPGALDRTGAILGVLPSQLSSLVDALARGLRPTRVGVVTAADKILPELVVEMEGEASTLRAHAGKLGPAAALLRDGARAKLQIRYHAEGAPLVAVEREIS